MTATQAAARQAARENLQHELVETLAAARQWLNGDKWRFGSPDQRKAWEDITKRMDQALALVRGQA
ncbi:MULTISPECIES: hypothetical protein [Cupriavidus]